MTHIHPSRMAITYFTRLPNLQTQIMFLDEVDNVDYRYKTVRFESFKNWPVTYIKPARLAAAGFYFTGKGDLVKCFYCHLELYKWIEGDNPIINHRRFSPTCRFIRNILYDNQSVDFDLNTVLSLTKEDTSTSESYDMERDCFTIKTEKAKHSSYSSYSLRIDTFENWPTSKTQTKEQLAEAGFFYTGVKDHVTCFYCGLGLSEWEDNDDPWKLHALWMNTCLYLREIKGQEYVDSFNIVEKRYLREIVSTFFYLFYISIFNCNNYCYTKEGPSSQDVETASESTIEENSGSNSGASNIHSDVESLLNNMSALSTTDKNNITSSSTETNSSTSTELMCLLCCKNERNVLFMSCGHVVACAECSKKLNDICPICRKLILGVLSVKYK